MNLNMKNIKNPGPIAIGALGGSGTRVVAQLLIDLGVFMGDNLNNSNDNLIFTYLFKRPRWFEKANDIEVEKHLLTFEKYMNGDKWNLNDLGIYLKAHFINRNFKVKNLSDLSNILLFLINYKRNNEIWGWKEPNTHIFLRNISQHFDDLKYIHVIRHGLDMAYSGNKQQLYSWGKKYGVDIPNDPELIPKAQLDYWIRANKEAVQTGKKLLKDKFYLQNFERLCTDTEKEVKKLLNFLNFDVSNEIIDRLVKLPSLPSTTGRYKDKDLSLFTDKQLNEITGLGFEI